MSTSTISKDPPFSVGSRLVKFWKEAVASSLRHVFEEMRRLESPRGHCSFDRRGLVDSLSIPGMVQRYSMDHLIPSPT
jgi:hypothetical protein